MSENNKYTMTWEEVYQRVDSLPIAYYYGVPRGGTIVAGLTRNAVLSPYNADYILDDLIDSGKTLDDYTERYKKPFYALVDKRKEFKNTWIEFPWETESELPAEDAVKRILQSFGEDLNREGLKDTPKRYVKFFQEFLNPQKFNLTTFNSEQYDEMITQSGIPFYSLCEHHIAPFFGTATVAYIPDGKIVGLSKLARTVDKFARRLQNQERLTQQIADYLQENLRPKGVAVTIKARHLCMEMRGIKKHDTYTTTSCLKGNFMNDEKARNEYLWLIK